MEFAEGLEVVGEVVFEGSAEGLVFDVGRDDAVAGEDAAGIDIDDEDGVVAGIEEDVVGGLGADAVECQEFFAQFTEGALGEVGHVTSVVGDEVFRKDAESFGLLPEVTGGAECGFEGGGIDIEEGLGRKEVLVFEVLDGSFDVGPGGVLGEDGADGDFEGAVAGPPVGGPVVVGHVLVEVGEGMSHISGWCHRVYSAC